MFGASSYSTDTHQGNLHQSSVTMSRMTYFILRVHSGTCLTTNNTEKKEEKKKLRRSFGENEGEWTGNVKISKKYIPGSRRSMHGSILT